LRREIEIVQAIVSIIAITVGHCSHPIASVGRKIQSKGLRGAVRVAWQDGVAFRSRVLDKESV
jgi:hypothetical protein